MAATMNLVISNSASSKLPVISEGHNLVSASPTSLSSNRRMVANDWATELRSRLNEAILSEEDPEESDIELLKQELISVFINALQKDNRSTWLLLRDILTVSVQYRDFIVIKPELTHYLKRLHLHLVRHQVQLFDLQILDVLKQVFPQLPQVVDDEPNKALQVFGHPTPPPLSQGPSTQRRKVQHPVATLPDGKNPYKLDAMDEADFKPKPLTFGDLRSSMAYVALEMATREAIWTACRVNTALALTVDLPEEDEEAIPSPNYPFQLSSSLEENALVILDTAGEPVTDLPTKPMTGREAVEYFTKCYHTGKIKSMHFNIAENRHFQPYDLVAVPKQKVNKEHYVFSTFGVLHVLADQPSENLSLSDWQRESVLFKAVSTIPFFKSYLIRKMFRRWHGNVKFARFARERFNIKTTLLQGIPGYAAALLQISALQQQLQTVEFLTFEKEKCYELGEFESVNIYQNVAVEQILERFFRYMKIIVTVTGEELLKKVHHCQEQVRQKPVLSRESLHLQRLKRERREENLRSAKQEFEKMPEFIALVNHMLLSLTFQMLRSTFCKFVEDTLTTGPSPVRDGLFKAKLVFDKQGNLSMHPPPEKFRQLLKKVVDDVPTMIVKSAEKLCESDESETAVHEETQSAIIEESPRQGSPRASSRQVSEISKLQSYASTMAMSSSTISKVEDCPKEEKQSAIADNSAEVTNAMDQTLQAPQMPLTKLPKKKDDKLGQATPRMILSRHGRLGRGHTAVPPVSFPLVNVENFQYIAQNDENYQASAAQQNMLIANALEEVLEYVSKNSWLSEIKRFCTQWSTESVKEFAGKAAYTIEQKLNEIRQWTDKVRAFDKTNTTENGLFFIDCIDVHNTLVPRLTQIFEEICDFEANEALTISKKFQRDMDAALNMLKKKDAAVGGFAEYARHVAFYKKSSPQYQQSVEYVKSLFEVIRMSHRQLSDDEEKLEETLWETWEAFLLEMQEASDYVNTQGSMKVQEITDTYSTKNGRTSISAISETDSLVTAFDPADNTAEFRMLEESAAELYTEATNINYTDANQDPSMIHSEVSKIRHEFHEVHEQMVQCNKWREVITGEPFDMSVVNEMMSQLDLQLELWQYIEVSMHQVKDWKLQLVKRFNVKKALDKVMEWQVAAGQLKDHLPETSTVLSHWYSKLQDFKKQLPIMYRLCSPVLKLRHLQRIFVEMGEQYDKTHDYTVGELMSYDLHVHAHNIQRIYKTAQNENMIEEDLANLSKAWDETTFKLAKHIPESIYSSDQTTEPPKSGLLKFRRAKSNTDSEPRLRAKMDDLYVVIEIPEMLYLIEDGQVVLQRILSSQFLSGHKKEAEKWENALQEAEQILGIWKIVQTNWLYLLKVFDKKEFYKKYEVLGKKFAVVHEKYRTFMLTVLDDPMVTSILTKPRGSPGFRQLQGARLKNYLTELVVLQEMILSEMTESIDGVRAQFPRLYFLSELETITLLSVSRNPTALVPHLKKCFSGITDMAFSLPKDVTGTGTSLDYSLLAHRLQVASVQGDLGEIMPLCTPMAASLDTCKWLTNLEKYMKSTVMKTLQACVEARLDGSQEVVKILEELLHCEATLEGKKEEQLAHEIKSKYAHWLLQFPAQCVLTSEAILFEKTVQKALSGGDVNDIVTVKDEQLAKIEQYVSVLKENVETDVESEERVRLHVLLGNLVGQTSYHCDILEGILQNKAVDPHNFSWLKVLRYHMDIERVLQAKTVTEFSKGLSNALEDSPSTDNKSELKRSKTTTTHTYLLGKCDVSQLTANFSYDYEYVGPTKRLTVTPLTERACITLTQALNGFQCGTLIGPSGTGKMTLVTDLAQALGRHLVTYNCNEDYTLKCMTKAFMGLMHSGCWVLWNSFDKLPYGLSSVIGQQFEYFANSLRVLASSTDNLYNIRDQQIQIESKSSRRRYTAATLHSISSNHNLISEKTDVSLVDDIRRFSIAKEINIKETSSSLPLVSEFEEDHDMLSNVSHLLGWTASFLGHILYNGHLVPVNANYGCFMNITLKEGQSLELPQNTKMQLRQCTLTPPDAKLLLDVQLLCEGFNNHQVWATKLALFFKILALQLPPLSRFETGIKMVMLVVSVAAKLLRKQRIQEKKHAHTRSKSATENKTSSVMSPEETSIVKAISECFVARMSNSQETNILKNTVRDVFPQSSRPKSASLGYPKELVTAIEEQLKQEHLQISQDLVDKTLLLYSALESSHGVILTGPVASGKSTCYKILAKALTSLSSGVEDELDGEVLTPERSVSFLYSQKLKILKDKNMRENAKDATKKWQKFTTMSNMLSKAATTFASVIVEDSDKVKNYPKISLHTVFPNVYSHQQLYGEYENGIWRAGLIERLLQNNKTGTFQTSSPGKKTNEKIKKIETPTLLHKWIAFDGEMHDDWMATLTTALDISSTLSLSNGGHVRVNDQTRLIFESADLHHASPGVVTHCSLVTCDADTVTWKCLWEGWGEKARRKWALNTAGWQVLTSLANTVFPTTLIFLKEECFTALVHGTDTSSQKQNQSATGVLEVTSFLNILSAFMDKHFIREDLEKVYAVQLRKQRSPLPNTPNSDSASKLLSMRFTPKSSSSVEDLVPNYMQAIKCLFAFSYIWSFAGNIHDSCQTKFEEFARAALGRAAQPIQLPPGKSVYDLIVDVRHGTWQTWNDRPLERPRPTMGHYNNTPQIERYNFLIDLMASTRHPILLTGAPGVGKTSLVENLVQSRHQYLKIVMTPGHDADLLQNMIMKRVLFQREENAKNAGLPGHQSDNRILFFIDDLSEASVTESSGIQPGLELMRQILTSGTILGNKKNLIHAVNNVSFIATATIPGKNVVSSRLTRLFATFNMFSPSDQELGTVYNKIIQNWLEEFPTNALDHHSELMKAIVRGSIDLYHMMKEHFPATPLRPHCAFSMYDLSHLFEGMLLLSPRIKMKPNKQNNGTGILPPMMRTVVRLWLHESCRVFADRLITVDETSHFESIASEVLMRHFCTDREPSPELRTSEVLIEQPQPMSTENTFNVSDESERGTANGRSDQEKLPSDSNEPESVPTRDLTTRTPLDVVHSPFAKTPAEQDNAGNNYLESSKRDSTSAKISKQTSRNGTSKTAGLSTSQESRLQTREGESHLTTDFDDYDDDSDNDEDNDSSSSSEESSSSGSSESEILVISETLIQKGIVQDKPPTPPDTGRTTARQSVRGLKKGVSFKVGLLCERGADIYYGPLLKYEQIMDPGERITDIIFSRYITAAYPVGNRIEKGYREGNITALTVALEMAQEKYNQEKEQKTELVFFREAVKHTARLTRVLTREGGNAVLVGLDHFTGCATLVRMAASLANVKLFEVVTGNNPEETRQLLHSQLQACSKSAAFVNRKVVLLVKDALGKQAMEDIYSFMKQGSCPHLYSEEDLSGIATRMTSSQAKITRQDKVDAAFTKYLKRVQQNVHVIICIKGQGKYPCRVTSEFPAFLKQPCMFDIYDPWTHEAYITIAEKWLMKREQMPVMWNDQDTVNQIKSTARAMAYIHNSSKKAIDMQYRQHLTQNRIHSPLKFKEFIYIFKVIAADISKKELEKLEKFEAGLDRVKEALSTIAQYQKEISQLNPVHKKALAVIDNHVKSIHAKQQEYIKALDVCKQQEKEIEELTIPVEKLRQETHDAIDKISPVFNAASTTLKCLSQADLHEVKSFKSPPYQVCRVMETVCLLFDIEPCWANAKSLMTRTSLYSDLEFYAKGGVSDHLFSKLGEFYFNKDMAPEKIMKVNKAAASFASWLQAVYIYADLIRKLAPKRKQLKQAEKKLSAAQLELGQHRLLANKVKSDLEAHIRSHKEAAQHAKTIEKSVQAVQKKMKTATNLMQNMDAQSTVWKIRSQECRRNLRSIPGDAVLAAAAVIYHGCLDGHSRASLMKDWMKRCQLNDFSISVIFSERNNQRLSRNLASTFNSINDGSEMHSEAISDSDDITSINSIGETSSNISAKSYHQSLSLEDLTQERILDQPMRGNKLSSNPAMNDDLLALRENFTVEGVLSSEDELNDWLLQSYPVDTCSIHNALVMRTTSHANPHCWPLLIDPDNTAEMWVRDMQSTDKFIHPEDLYGSDDSDMLELVMEGDFPSERMVDGALSRATGTSGETMSGPPSSRPVTRGDTPRATLAATETSATTDNQSDLDHDPTINILDLSDTQPDKLWVVRADDETIVQKILTALVQGLAVLVTHLEYRQIPSILNPLMFKHWYLDRDGVCKVTVGNNQYNWHRDFRLYLSTSLPIAMQDMTVLRKELERTTVIDMSVGQEGIINKLLCTIMTKERPEHETQKRTSSKDIIYHQREIHQEQELIFQRVLNLTVPLLDDPEMLDKLVKCQHNIQHNSTALEDIHYHIIRQDEKQTPYLPVATSAAHLFGIIKKIEPLNPLYHVSLTQFYDIVGKTVLREYRGKGAQGAPKARAQELIQHITGDVFRFVSNMANETHSLLFALLIALERLTYSRKLTSQELDIFVKSIKTERKPAITTQEKPGWLGEQAWQDCHTLETLLPGVDGICKSFGEYNSEWEEYFQCPIVLMNQLPDFKYMSLTAFEKCILWRVCCPHKLYEVCEALILHELGGTCKPEKYNHMREVIAQSNRFTPVLFIESTNNQHDTATNAITQHAKDVGMEGKVHVVSCGLDIQMTNIQEKLTESIQNGHWLVIQNAHLVSEWTSDIVELFKRIVGPRQDKEGISSINSSRQSERTNVINTGLENEELTVHHDFRLFVATTANTELSLPGLILQNSLKVSHEQTTDIKETFMYCYNIVSQIVAKADVNSVTKDGIMVSLTLLHSILKHSTFYGCSAYENIPDWTIATLSKATEAFIDSARLKTSHCCLQQTLYKIYCDQCFVVQDRKAVKDLIMTVIIRSEDIQKISESAAGIPGLLKQLIKTVGNETAEGMTTDQKLLCLSNFNSETLGLPASCERTLTTQKSRELLEALELVLDVQERPGTKTDHDLWHGSSILEQLELMLDDLPALPKTKADGFYPMEIFLHSEVEAWKQMLFTLKSDIHQLQGIARGDTPGTPSHEKMMKDISFDGIPASWQLWTSAAIPLNHWFQQMKTRIQLLNKYAKEEKPAAFNLNVFLRPDRFIQCVIQAHARKQFKDVSQLVLDVQVMDKNIAQGAPTEGVYIEGLQLHNASWNQTKGITPSENGTDNIQDLPLVLVKPKEIKMQQKENENSEDNSVFVCPVCVDGKKLAFQIPFHCQQNHQTFLSQHRTHISSTFSKLFI